MSVITKTKPLLRIELPPLKQAQLVTLDGHEEFNNEFQFTLQVSSPTNIPATSLLEKNASIAIQADDNLPPRWINGIITQASRDLDTPHQHHQYTLRLEPEFTLLKHTSNCRLFHQQTITNIIATLFHEHGIQACASHLLQQSTDPIMHCTQYNESGYDFIKRLLAENGISYFYQHSNNSHILTLVDDLSALEVTQKPIPLMQQQPSPHMFKERTITADTLSLGDYDYTQASSAIKLRTETNVEQSLQLNQPLDQFQYPAEPDLEAALKQLSQRHHHVQQLQMQHQGKSTNTHLTTGQQFQIDSTENPGQWAVMRLYHRAEDRQMRPSQSKLDSASMHYENEFCCIPATTPIAREPRQPPSIQGSQTATVIGIDQSPIETDGLARIKIQFHWQNSADQSQARWVRVKQLLAGSQWGALFLPRIGSEVVVEFINGNPNRPVVVGQAFNSKENTAYPPQQDEISGIKLNSFNRNSTVYNAIEFNDQPDSQALSFYAGKTLDIDINHNHVQQTGYNYSITSNTGNQREEAKNRISISSKQHMTLSCAGSKIILNDQGISLDGAVININA